jgi:hypothetical protein
MFLALATRGKGEVEGTLLWEGISLGSRLLPPSSTLHSLTASPALNPSLTLIKVLYTPSSTVEGPLHTKKTHTPF